MLNLNFCKYSVIYSEPRGFGVLLVTMGNKQNQSGTYDKSMNDHPDVIQNSSSNSCTEYRVIFYNNQCMEEIQQRWNNSYSIFTPIPDNVNTIITEYSDNITIW